MDAIANAVKDKVMDVVSDLGIPVMGEDEDVAKAKEVIGDKGKVYGALSVPEDALQIPTIFYCLCCFLPPFISAKRRLENTLYIITEKGVKVHVEPYEPFMGLGDADNDNMDISMDDISDVKIVKKQEGCMGGCTSDKIVLEGPGVELYVADVDTVGDALKKLKTMAAAGKGAAAAAEALAT